MTAWQIESRSLILEHMALEPRVDVATVDFERGPERCVIVTGLGGERESAFAILPDDPQPSSQGEPSLREQSGGNMIRLA